MIKEIIFYMFIVLIMIFVINLAISNIKDFNFITQCIAVEIMLLSLLFFSKIIFISKKDLGG
jgi:hypothetical protein